MSKPYLLEKNKFLFYYAQMAQTEVKTILCPEYLDFFNA